MGELTFACDERDELRDAFLHAFLGLLCDFRVLRQRGLHDSGNWSKVTNVSVIVAFTGIELTGVLLLLRG